MFGAVDHPVAAVLHGGAAHAAYVGARVRFAHRQTVDAFTGDGGNEVFLNLVAGACAQDVRRARNDVVEGVRGSAQLAIDEGGVERIEPAAAEFRGHVAGVDACGNGALFDLLYEVIRYFAELFDGVFVRHQFFLGELARGGDDGVLFVGEREVHCCSFFPDSRLFVADLHDAPHAVG